VKVVHDVLLDLTTEGVRHFDRVPEDVTSESTHHRSALEGGTLAWA
jgi:hypothetical protein